MIPCFPWLSPVSIADGYEIHVFDEPGDWTLAFSDGRTNLTADYLIMAGGGGTGGSVVANADHSGGGAGGLLYLTDQDLVLDEASSVNIVVGAGGQGGIVIIRFKQ